MHKCLAVFFLIISAAYPQKGDEKFFYKVDKFFKKHCVNGGVNYSAVRDARIEAEDISLLIKNTNLDKTDPLYRKAFYINVYNFLVIKTIAENKNSESVKKIKGFFNSKVHDVAGEKLTLNDIAEKKLRKMFFDSRVHFVLVNGAKGSPKAQNFAYTSSSLDDQMNSMTRKALNDSRFIIVDKKNKKAILSEIFKTYKDEFVTPKTGYLDFINLYRIEKIPSDYKIEFFDFDWSLNDTK